MKKIIVIILVALTTQIKATNWMYSFENAKKIAIATNKLILVDFYADWCGPCKKMDMDTWSKQEVTDLTNNFIPLKIDIDIHKDIARKYNVRGIPYILIVDPYGEVVYDKMGYQKKSDIIRLLKKYSVNTKLLQQDFSNFFKVKTGDNALKIAEKYLDFSVYVNKDIRSDFIKVARNYIKKSKKLYKKENNKHKEKQKIELLEIYRNILSNRYKRVLKTLDEKFNENEIKEENKSLYNFLYYTAYSKLKDKENANIWYQKIRKDKNFRVLLLKARKI